MVYSFTESTLVMAVQSAMSRHLQNIPDPAMRKGIEAAILAAVGVIADEFELIDAEI